MPAHSYAPVRFFAKNSGMNPQAIKSAKTRLSRAEAAFLRLTVPKSVDHARDAWSNLLTAAGQIYNKILNGKNETSASKGWMDKMKSERKSDPLLRYMMQARHIEEHGVEESAGQTNPSVAIRGPSGVVMGFESADPDEQPKIESIRVFDLGSGGEIRMAREDELWAEEHPPELKLIPVTDGRSGTTYEPPTSHLGQKIDMNVTECAGLLLVYLRRMIAEAEKFV